MDVRKLFVFLVLLFTLCLTEADGKSTTFIDTALRNMEQSYPALHHHLVKRQGTWLGCGACGYGTKTDKDKLIKKEIETTTETSTETKKSIKCKDVPSFSVCKLLKRLGGKVFG